MWNQGNKMSEHVGWYDQANWYGSLKNGFWNGQIKEIEAFSTKTSTYIFGT